MIEITDLNSTDEQITDYLKSVCSPKTPLFELCTAMRLVDVRGGDDYERGIIEGMRRMCAELQDRALSKTESLQIKSTVKESENAA